MKKNYIIPTTEISLWLQQHALCASNDKTPDLYFTGYKVDPDNAL